MWTLLEIYLEKIWKNILQFSYLLIYYKIIYLFIY